MKDRDEHSRATEGAFSKGRKAGSKEHKERKVRKEKPEKKREIEQKKTRNEREKENVL